jgi:hypothetical protein
MHYFFASCFTFLHNFLKLLTLWFLWEEGSGNPEFGREVMKAWPGIVLPEIELGFSQTICHRGSSLTI